MITIIKHSFMMFTLFSITSSESTYEGLSKITVNENFKDPVPMPPLDSPNGFVRQGTNFFLDPQFLLGRLVQSPRNRDVRKEYITIPDKGNKNLAVNISKIFEKPIDIRGKKENISKLNHDFKTIAVKNIPIAPASKETIEEVVEPHDIITISDELQPVLRPEIDITQQLWTIPEAPMLPPLVIPELPVKLSIEETVPVPVELPLMSESEFYVPIGPLKIPFLTESIEHKPVIRELDYNINKIPPAKIELLKFGIPFPPVYIRNIVAKPVYPEIYKLNERTITKSIETSYPSPPISLFFDKQIPTSNMQ